MLYIETEEQPDVIKQKITMCLDSLTGLVYEFNTDHWIGEHSDGDIRMIFTIHLYSDTNNKTIIDVYSKEHDLSIFSELYSAILLTFGHAHSSYSPLRTPNGLSDFHVENRIRQYLKVISRKPETKLMIVKNLCLYSFQSNMLAQLAKQKAIYKLAEIFTPFLI